MLGIKKIITCTKPQPQVFSKKVPNSTVFKGLLGDKEQNIVVCLQNQDTGEREKEIDFLKKKQ